MIVFEDLATYSYQLPSAINLSVNMLDLFILFHKAPPDTAALDNVVYSLRYSEYSLIHSFIINKYSSTYFIYA